MLFMRFGSSSQSPPNVVYSIMLCYDVWYGICMNVCMHACKHVCMYYLCTYNVRVCTNT